MPSEKQGGYEPMVMMVNWSFSVWLWWFWWTCWRNTPSFWSRCLLSISVLGLLIMTVLKTGRCSRSGCILPVIWTIITHQNLGDHASSVWPPTNLLTTSLSITKRYQLFLLAIDEHWPSTTTCQHTTPTSSHIRLCLLSSFWTTINITSDGYQPFTTVVKHQ